MATKPQLTLMLGFAFSKQADFLKMMAEKSADVTLMKLNRDNHVTTVVVRAKDTESLKRFRKFVSDSLV